MQDSQRPLSHCSELTVRLSQLRCDLGVGGWGCRGRQTSINTKRSFDAFISSLWYETTFFPGNKEVKRTNCFSQIYCEKCSIKLPLPSRKTWLAPPGTTAWPCCSHRYGCYGNGSFQLQHKTRETTVISLHAAIKQITSVSVTAVYLVMRKTWCWHV